MGEHHLVAAASTDNPCLLVLRDKGYRFWIECYRNRIRDSVTCGYWAEKDQKSFVAKSGAELLGVVTLWETFGGDWCRQEPDVMSGITEEVDVTDIEEGEA